MKPLFSIITVSYNSVRTIDRTIKSILKQSFIDYEYIIIDGASTDGTIDLIKQNEHLFNGRLKWVSEPDGGIYNAMNKGIGLAKGKIIGIVNSDDWLEQNALETVWDEFKLNGESLNSVYCGWINFMYDNQENTILKTNKAKFEENAKKYLTLAGVRHPAVFVPKELYNQYGLFDERITVTADADFLHRLYFASIKFIFIDKVLSNMSDGGISNNSLNISILQNRYNDYKIRILKYNVPNIRKLYLLSRFRFLLIIKSILPKSLLKHIRRKANS